MPIVVPVVEIVVAILPILADIVAAILPILAAAIAEVFPRRETVL
jgi:hypothetical protein